MSEIGVFGGESNGFSPFDKIRRVDDQGEYWSARELMGNLSYTEWRNFQQVVLQAKIIVEASSHDSQQQVVERTTLLPRGTRGGTQEVDDYRLSRFACYMVTLCADVKKPAVATGRVYFAVRARQAEVAEQRNAPENLTVSEFSQRIKRSHLNHIKHIDQQFSPGDYTILSGLFGQFQTMDDELIIHGIVMEADDRPDTSIGMLWSKHAKKIGILPFEKKAPLLMPGLTVNVNVWPASSYVEFRRWFKEDYGMGKLRNYLLNKKEFVEMHGKHAIESAIYNVCLAWTGMVHPEIPYETLKMIRDNNGVIRSQKRLGS